MEWKQKVRHELSEYWSSVAYLAIFFCVFVNYRRLVLADYKISYHAYWISLIKALVLAKVILVARSLRLDRGFEDKPLIVPTLHKAFLFTVCVAFFEAIESMIGSFLHGRGLTEATADLITGFDSERLAGALVVFSALIPFFAVKEINARLGDGAITKLLFRRRPATENGFGCKFSDSERDTASGEVRSQRQTG